MIINHVTQNKVFIRTSRFCFTTHKYSHIKNANKKNTSYLKPRKDDFLNSKNGKYRKTIEHIMNAVIVQSR